MVMVHTLIFCMALISREHRNRNGRLKVVYVQLAWNGPQAGDMTSRVAIDRAVSEVGAPWTCYCATCRVGVCGRVGALLELRNGAQLGRGASRLRLMDSRRQTA